MKKNWKYETGVVVTRRRREGTLSNGSKYVVVKTRLHEPDGKLGKVIQTTGRLKSGKTGEITQRTSKSQ